MRIIHDITAPMQVSGGITPYSQRPGTVGFSGGRVELLLCTSPRANFAEKAKVCEPEDTEVIYIEGGLEYVLDALKQAVHILEYSKKRLQESGVTRPLGCPECPESMPGSHTWECQAKWNDQARKVLEETADMADIQKHMVARAIAPHHLECGGAGCSDCDWMGEDISSNVVEKAELSPANI